MKAMILAAGRGERLRPFTDRCPKPLLEIAGQPLLAHHLQRLAAAGFREVVINTAYRGRQIREAIGDGARFGLRITYTQETPGALDTGGGVAHALSWLDNAYFAIISADVVSDIDYRALRTPPPGDGMHLMLVDNPAHHREGDFSLAAPESGAAPRRILREPSEARLTYAGVGVYSAALFAARAGERFALADVMRQAIAAEAATGAHHRGRWVDVGRAATLAMARQPMFGCD